MLLAEKKKSSHIFAGYQEKHMLLLIIDILQGLKKETKFTHSFHVTRVFISYSLPTNCRSNNAVGCVFLSNRRLIPTTIPTRYAVSGSIADFFFFSDLIFNLNIIIWMITFSSFSKNIKETI